MTDSLALFFPARCCRSVRLVAFARPHRRPGLDPLSLLALPLAFPFPLSRALYPRSHCFIHPNPLPYCSLLQLGLYRYQHPHSQLVTYTSPFICLPLLTSSSSSSTSSHLRLRLPLLSISIPSPPQTSRPPSHLLLASLFIPCRICTCFPFSQLWFASISPSFLHLPTVSNERKTPTSR